jgi:hemoglobin-like flavoprotein
MTPAQIALVQSSFRLVEPILDAAAGMFYDRLFELDPSLRHLFHTSREDQSRKLAQALAIVVKSLDRPEQIQGAVESLGRRHAAYGVRDDHYTTVGEALLWTLSAGLGDAFSRDVREAWAAAYAWIACTMRCAAAMASAIDDATVSSQVCSAPRSENRCVPYAVRQLLTTTALVLLLFAPTTALALQKSMVGTPEPLHDHQRRHLQPIAVPHRVFADHDVAFSVTWTRPSRSSTR